MRTSVGRIGAMGAKYFVQLSCPHQLLPLCHASGYNYLPLMIFMPLEPLANEAIQLHSILCANNYTK